MVGEVVSIPSSYRERDWLERPSPYVFSKKLFLYISDFQTDICVGAVESRKCVYVLQRGLRADGPKSMKHEKYFQNFKRCNHSNLLPLCCRLLQGQRHRQSPYPCQRLLHLTRGNWHEKPDRRGRLLWRQSHYSRFLYLRRCRAIQSHSTSRQRLHLHHLW